MWGEIVCTRLTRPPTHATLILLNASLCFSSTSLTDSFSFLLLSHTEGIRFGEISWWERKRWDWLFAWYCSCLSLHVSQGSRETCHVSLLYFMFEHACTCRYISEFSRGTLSSDVIGLPTRSLHSPRLFNSRACEENPVCGVNYPVISSLFSFDDIEQNEARLCLLRSNK